MPHGNVIPIGGIEKLDLPVDEVLEAAKGDLQGVVILGFDKDGDMCFGSTYADGADILWLLESCKKILLEAAMYDQD